MARAKRIMLCLLACTTASAFWAAAASATSPAWWVEGSPLASGKTEAVAETTEVVKSFVVKVLGITTECTSAKAKSTFIEGENKATAKALVFEGCSTSVPNCAVVGSAIETKPLSILLEGSKGALKLNFKPATGTELETINLTGSGCLITKVVVTGTMACNYPGVETEMTSHLLEFTATSGSNLEALGAKAELTGLDRFWLASNKKWSAK